MCKIVIIGGGASGIVASIFASKKNNEVIIIEKNSDVLKKLLITGNGRCNYFNDDMNLKHFYTNGESDISKIINSNNINEIKRFFDKIGIIPKIKNGYYYPYSNTSSSIYNSLKIEAINNGVKIINDFDVINVEKKEKFFISSSSKTITCDKLILACGSKAYPKTGSDGFGYKLLEKFNLDIIKPLPALVQLELDFPSLKKWSGIRSEVKIDLIENDKIIKSEIGEILLTDYGISGICTFNLSGLAIRGLENNKKEEIVINFVNMLNLKSKADFINYMDERSNNLLNRNIGELFDGFINYKLVNILLGKYKEKKWMKLKREEKEAIAKKFYCLKIPITGYKSFDKSQTVSGGLSLSEVNLETFELKKINDFYVVGELLDIYGDCGGYNLTLSFITGMIAGKNI